MIRLENVTRRFGEVVAVDKLSLEVPRGEVCVIIGPSGCGKTTTLRLINRLTEPDSGKVYVDGKDTGGMRPEELRRGIGYAIQSVGLFPHLTVGANIATVPQLLRWDRARTERRVRELLELVGLDPARYMGKYPHQLSGGEAQRIGVARALAADPPVLLMDEPFGAVDPLTRQKLQSEFSRIQQRLKKTVVLVTHDLDEAIRLADRIAIMESGRLVQYDTPENILSRPVNRFVRDFVGTDRALKRLSRIRISGFVKPVPSLSAAATMDSARSAIGDAASIWVVDDRGRPVGWLDRADINQVRAVSEALMRADLAEIAINNSATMREALSRMMGHGFEHLPVVDDDGRLLGELTLRDIEAATIQSEARDA